MGHLLDLQERTCKGLQQSNDECCNCRDVNEIVFVFERVKKHGYLAECDQGDEMSAFSTILNEVLIHSLRGCYAKQVHCPRQELYTADTSGASSRRWTKKMRGERRQELRGGETEDVLLGDIKSILGARYMEGDFNSDS